MALPACSTLTRVDAPFTLRSDDRLEIVSPSDADEVDLPVTVKWRVSDFPLTDGNGFAVFLDRAPVGVRRQLSLKTCPPIDPAAPPLVEDCDDDRESVFLASDTEHTLSCLAPREGPKRRRNVHEVVVILVDTNGNRLGEAAASVTFKVNEDAVSRCEGRGPWEHGT